MANNIAGLVDTRDQAQNIVDDLLKNKFNQDQISFVAKDETGEYTAERVPIGSAEKGVEAGAAVGGGAAFLAGIAGIAAVPAAGPVIAAGTLLAALAGAGAGGLVGGIIGALTQGGVSEEDARFFAEGVRKGGILVTVHSEADRSEEVRRIMEQNGAVTEWNENGTPRGR